MASAARIHAIERGKDVGKFPIFAFGGAGPVHAYGVARILRSPRVIYPLGAGVMSTVGFLVAPLAFDFVRTLPGGLDELDWAAVARVVDAMEREGRALLGGTLPADRITFRRYADMRYRKQGYEIRVPVPAGPSSIEFSYRPLDLYVGAAISLFTLMTMIVALILSHRRGAAHRASAPRQN